jgi:hypothetical protein
MILRVDLEAAGIPYETDAGIADFHSLRGCYISYLVSSGASVKTCQTLARHSTPSLTIGVYAKASLHDISGAVEALPDLTTRARQPKALRKTGTDGAATESATELPIEQPAETPQVQVWNGDPCGEIGDSPADSMSVVLSRASSEEIRSGPQIEFSTRTTRPEAGASSQAKEFRGGGVAGCTWSGRAASSRGRSRACFTGKRLRTRVATAAAMEQGALDGFGPKPRCACGATANCLS